MHPHPQQRTVFAHRKALLENVASLESLTLPVNLDLLGRVLKSAPAARLAIPPFSNSAMDGFLVNSTDVAGCLPVTLTVIGEVAAGSKPLSPAPGQAVRIMTGAPVVEDNAHLTVIPVEDTDIPSGPFPLPEKVTVFTASNRRHIRQRGENLAPGQTIGPAPTVINPGTLAALISAGVNVVEVLKVPKVAVISSGQELVATHQGQDFTPGFEPETQPVTQSENQPELELGKIPDSNGPMVAGLCATNLGVNPNAVTLAHCGDNAGDFAALLTRLSATHDLIVTTGGVSAGAFDVVQETLSAGGSSAWFGHVSQKPGAPQGMGTWEGTPVVCLPGNPVAAFVSFHLYVAPVLARLAGRSVDSHPGYQPAVQALAGGKFQEPRRGVELVVPVTLEPAPGGDSLPTALPFSAAGIGSHHVGSLSGVNGLVVIDADHPMTDGQVRVQLI